MGGAGELGGEGDRERDTAVSLCARIIGTDERQGLEREWAEHGIARYTGLICGQEMGTKTEQIAAVSVHYQKGHVLMIGDAPGDMRAARANGALFRNVDRAVRVGAPRASTLGGERMNTDVGVIGLAVMGQNLALNVESRGYTVAVYNRTRARTEEFMSQKGVGKKIIPTGECPLLRYLASY